MGNNSISKQLTPRKGMLSKIHEDNTSELPVTGSSVTNNKYVNYLFFFFRRKEMKAESEKHPEMFSIWIVIWINKDTENLQEEMLL